MKPLVFSLCVLAALLSGCRVTDEREMTIRLPGLSSEADQAKITGAVSALPGVDMQRLAFDRKGRTLTVRYDSMRVAQKNIEIAIAEAGYDANGIPATGKK